MSVVAFRTKAEIERAVPDAVAHLSRGGLVAHPTETVYGLGSRALESDVAKLRRLKGRLSGDPFLLLIDSIQMARGLGLRFPPYGRELAERYWPGPLTLVLGGGEGVPNSLRGAAGGVAVRWTPHAGAARLVAALGEPITSTSANLHGGETAPTAGAVRELFEAAVRDGVLMVLDGGSLEGGRPSTVVDCMGRVPRLIREGAVSWSEITRFVGSPVQ
ncbi:MAG: L-threonylcarbamoyladenylate synthase [Gemmatimonadales bacterium]